MAGKRKTPRLRFDGGYYVVNIYKPEGGRTTISFGPPGERTEGQVYTAFGQWLDLFEQNPHKVLMFRSPYDAIDGMTNPNGVLTVGELLDQHMAWAKKRKLPVRHGKKHPDLRFIDRVHRFLEPYKQWPLTSFGPDELEAVQEALCQHEYSHGKEENKKRYTRRGINDIIAWVHRIWKWGLGRGFVPHTCVQGLREVKPLKMGDGRSFDNPKRSRVTEEEFQKLVAELSSVVGNMCQLMWYTAMRPYEVCDMRPFDILTEDSECWLYVPGRDRSPVGDHKTTRFGRVKVVPLTQKSQDILQPRITDWNSKQFIFSPKQAMTEFLEEKARKRDTPLNKGNRPGTNRKEHPMIVPGDHYNTSTLEHAMARACNRAGIEKIRPYDLRRTMATGTRSILDKEAARSLLGHVSTDTTEPYFLEEVQEAIKVAKKLAVAHEAEEAKAKEKQKAEEQKKPKERKKRKKSKKRKQKKSKKRSKASAKKN